MNKTLDKIVQTAKNIAKPVAKAVVLPLIMTAAAYSADAQTYKNRAEEIAAWDKPTTSHVINVVLEEEKRKIKGLMPSDLPS